MSATINTRASWKVVKPGLIPKTYKSRRGTKTRSWTAQEERYLLDCRDRRLPYRRIATQLNKTELACRLHYHQLTVVRARPEEDASTITTVALSPETVASTCDEPSPKSVHEQLTTSPETELRTLPPIRRHQWQNSYSSCYDHRSTSLPTPTPSRVGTPQSVTSQSSPNHHHYHYHDCRRQSAPSYPPRTQHPSSRLLPPTAGLGLSALGSTTNTHQRHFSYPPHPATTRPTYFPPTPKASHDDGPAAAAAAATTYYASSQWGQWTSRRFPVASPGSLQAGCGEVGTLAAQLQYQSGRPAERRASEGRASGLDRCSVSALLNP